MNGIQHGGTRQKNLDLLCYYSTLLMVRNTANVSSFPATCVYDIPIYSHHSTTYSHTFDIISPNFFFTALES